jgi:hypothetical protein
MGEKRSREEQPQFTDIVKKAYDRGISEQEVTVEKLMEELKVDLKKMRSTHV